MSNTDLFVAMKFDSLPEEFPSPFDVTPHAAAQQAAESLKLRLKELYLPQHCFDEVDGGKMFGVLVVKTVNGKTGYLAAYSGMLGGQWCNSGFVPPVFDETSRDKLLHCGENEIAKLGRQIEQLEVDSVYLQVKSKIEQYRSTCNQQLNSLKQLHQDRKRKRHELRQLAVVSETQIEELANQSREDKYELKLLKTRIQTGLENLNSELQEHQLKLELIKKTRKKVSAKLQRQLFDGYQLQCADGSSKPMTELFEDVLPPSGAGDCAATKLVHHANSIGLLPIALAEFWWGASPPGALRKHERYYPSCRSRCRKLLPALLKGLLVTVPLHEQPVSFAATIPKTLFEDEHIVVVDKPASLLSVPGKALTDSVEQRLKSRYPEVSGVMLLHRLDQATSGVMIAARNPAAYKSLQHQFEDRTVSKMYIAVLDGVLTQDEGEIALPLRIDFYDRPRQIVCHERGKASLTKYSVISRDSTTTRVAFFPHTGRTHQLRVHAAHPEGLDCAILGDELYGRTEQRMYLHAAQLTIMHPVKHVRMKFESDPDF